MSSLLLVACWLVGCSWLADADTSVQVLQPQRQRRQQDDTSSVLPFLWVWRLEMISSETNDRQPTTAEYGGVAQATASWLMDTLPTVDSFTTMESIMTPFSRTLSLLEVTATVRNDTTFPSWDPDRTLAPHIVSLDCTVTLESSGGDDEATTINIITMDTLRRLIADISFNDLKVFVSNYIRVIGPSDSVFQFTKQSATYISQISDNNADNEQAEEGGGDHHQSHHDGGSDAVVEESTGGAPTSSAVPSESNAPSWNPSVSTAPSVSSVPSVSPTISPMATALDDRNISPDLVDTP